MNPLWIPLIERHALHYLAVASKLESPHVQTPESEPRKPQSLKVQVPTLQLVAGLFLGLQDVQEGSAWRQNP